MEKGKRRAAEPEITKKKKKKKKIQNGIPGEELLGTPSLIESNSLVLDANLHPGR